MTNVTLAFLILSGYHKHLTTSNIESVAEEQSITVQEIICLSV